MTADIRDIAKAAGVSVTTVSHSLSGRGRVAPATRGRVLDIAKRLGYTANVHAQRLASGRSRTLAIQVAGFASDGGENLLLPDAAYFMDVLNGAASAAAKNGYAILLAPYDVQARQIHPLAIDGAIIVDPGADEMLAPVLLERGTALVTTGRPMSGAADPPWVDNDHGGLAREMLEHMTAMGYARPAVMATTRSRSYVADILHAYDEWCAVAGVKPRVVELPEPPSEDAAARAAHRLLTGRNRPDVVYATYDRLALGILREAQRLGIAVPDELGIASAVDSDALRWASPHITATFLDARRIGAEAVRLLLDCIEGREAGAGVVVSGRVLPRSSTQPPQLPQLPKLQAASR